MSVGAERANPQAASAATDSIPNDNPEGERPALTRDSSSSMAEDGGGEPDNVDEPMPHYLQGPLDLERLKLEPQERQWAMDIKEMANGLPDLDPLSDFMCAHLALVEQGNVEKAIQQAYQLQAYRQEYDILDTFEDGKRALSRFLQLIPGHVLHFFYCRAQGRYVVVSDITKINPKAFANFRDRHVSFSGGYYFPHAIHLDLESIRKGVIFTVECEGFLRNVPEMMNFAFFRLWHEDVAAPYPTHYYEIQYFNVGLFLNTMLSMVRRFVPESIKSKMVLGCRSDVRLDTLCLVPTKQMALARLERELIEALRRRYEAERIFRL